MCVDKDLEGEILGFLIFEGMPFSVTFIFNFIQFYTIIFYAKILDFFYN